MMETQIEFLRTGIKIEFQNRRKTVVVIDKNRFLITKQLMLENAPDEDYAAFLNIPLSTVRYYKHKMQIFEDSIRARRRAARLKAQRMKKEKPAVISDTTENKRKRPISANERFRRARELIEKNYGTNHISKILKISERSVTRFKKRIREEKRRLRNEGKIQVSLDDNCFKYLSANEKIKRAEELFKKKLKIFEISEILKVSERTVRRWKERLDKMDKNEYFRVSSARNSKDAEDPDDESKIKRKRRTQIDRDKVIYATELIENGLSNKEMSILLEMSISCVRKLKAKILNGTAEELIDDTEEHYKNVSASISDPLHNDFTRQEVLMPEITPKATCERKPKVNLSDREMHIARLLRDNNLRTMDIARLLDVSERSVTRLLSKSKEQSIVKYDKSIISEVERLLACKNEILNDTGVVVDSKPDIVTEESKENIGISLLAMKVKVKDIAKMLDVSENAVWRWRTKMFDVHEKGQSQSCAKIEPNDEYIVEYLE